MTKEQMNSLERYDTLMVVKSCYGYLPGEVIQFDAWFGKSREKLFVLNHPCYIIDSNCVGVGGFLETDENSKIKNRAILEQYMIINKV